jgi:hypothetical protein
VNLLCLGAKQWAKNFANGRRRNNKWVLRTANKQFQIWKFGEEIE